MRDYLASSIPDKFLDPVIVAIPVKWMKQVITASPDAFDIFMDNMYTTDAFEEKGMIRSDYTESTNGKNGTLDDLQGWIRATKEMIIEADGEGAWEHFRKIIPPRVMMGYDMEIGASGMGPAFRQLLSQPALKNVDRLVIPIHKIIGSDGLAMPNNDILSMISSAHIDGDGTLKIEGGGSNDYEEISIGLLELEVRDLLSSSGLLPQGLYELKNLSDTHISKNPSSINYNRLKI